MAKTNEMEKKEGQELVRIYETAAAALKMKLNPFAPLLKKLLTTSSVSTYLYIPGYLSFLLISPSLAFFQSSLAYPGNLAPISDAWILLTRCTYEYKRIRLN